MLAFFIIMASVPVISLFYKDEMIRKRDQYAAAAGTQAQSSTVQAAGTAVQSGKEQSDSRRQTSAAAKETASPAAAKADKVRVLLHKDNRVVTVKTASYILCVMAKEIDIDSPEEALKAQAVCIYTFLLHSMQQAQSANYDITDDPAHHQSFLSEKALKTFWGEAYEKNYRKLQKIVDSVSGEYLSCEGKPILAAYHSSNAGMTESAANYWGEDYPYLQAKESIGDSLSRYYKTKVSFTPAKLKKALLTLKKKDFSFPKSPSDWIGACRTTPSQTVETVDIAGVSLSGRELREALGLKSSFFTVEYNGKQFLFTVSGYGHGVGMSQEGAKYMASLGFTYQEILKHYYEGAVLDK